MNKKLLKLFTSFGFVVYVNKEDFTYNIDTEHFGSICGNFDFASNKFTVIFKLDEEQYMNIYMTDEVDYAYIDEWNWSNTYFKLEKALQKIIELIDKLDKEVDRSLDELFINFAVSLESFIKSL